MSKNNMKKSNNKKPSFHCTSEAQKRAIAASYVEKKKKESSVGKVYRGNTKYIDKEPKRQRNYVVTADNGKSVSVAKLKTIKSFDSNGKNADKDLVEINAERYGLKNRTGVDSQSYSKNRISQKSLTLTDRDVFPEDQEQFVLGSHDTHRVLKHTGRVLKSKKKGQT